MRRGQRCIYHFQQNKQSNVVCSLCFFLSMWDFIYTTLIFIMICNHHKYFLILYVFVRPIMTSWHSLCVLQAYIIQIVTDILVPNRRQFIRNLHADLTGSFSVGWIVLHNITRYVHETNVVLRSWEVDNLVDSLSLMGCYYPNNNAVCVSIDATYGILGHTVKSLI